MRKGYLSAQEPERAQKTMKTAEALPDFSQQIVAIVSGVVDGGDSLGSDG
jgi:hypothetical protein